MYWANFLHIYQPPNQDKYVLGEIVVQSYRPLLKGLLNHPGVKMNLNVNGCLLDLFEKEGYGDILDLMRELLKRGQLQLSGSAKYHAFLPLLPSAEVKRQIEENERTLNRFFPNLWQKEGFFSPELAYDFATAQLVSQMGYKWIVAPQVAYGANPPHFNRSYQIKGLENFGIFFRDKRVSVIILSGYAHSSQSFFTEIPDIMREENRYILTVMDGETFGHHRPGLEKFLEELYQASELKTVFISELPLIFSTTETVEARSSTWSNEEQDFWLDKERTTVSQNPFLLWYDPANEIHKWQWEFTNWVIEQVQNSKAKIRGEAEEEKWEEARRKLDEALSSDQYWWASAKPWWSLEMIENGVFYLKEVINDLFGEKSAQGKKAFDYYLKVLLLACQWQRDGTVKSRFQKTRNPILDIPFKDRVSKDEFNQMILEFEDEMKKAAANMEYEKAVRWRDAIAKLSTRTDCFDAVHMVDQLWTARKLPTLKPYLEYKDEEISEFAKKNLLP